MGIDVDSGKKRVDLGGSILGTSVFSEETKKLLGDDLLRELEKIGISSVNIRIKNGAIYFAIPYLPKNKDDPQGEIKKLDLKPITQTIHKHFPGAHGAVIVYPIKDKVKNRGSFLFSENTSTSRQNNITTKLHDKLSELLSGLSAPRSKPLIIECRQSKDPKISLRVAFVEINLQKSQKIEFDRRINDKIEQIENEENLIICFHQNTITSAIDSKLKNIANGAELISYDGIKRIRKNMHKISGASFSKKDFEELGKAHKKFRTELFEDLTDEYGFCIDQEKDEPFPEDLIIFKKAEYIPREKLTDNILYVCFPVPAAYLEDGENLLEKLKERTLSIFAQAAFEPIATHHSLAAGYSYDSKQPVYSIAVKYTWDIEDSFVNAKEEVAAVKVKRKRQYSFNEADEELNKEGTILSSLAFVLSKPSALSDVRRVKSLKDSARLIQFLMEESKSALGKFCREGKFPVIYRGTKDKLKDPSLEHILNQLGDISEDLTNETLLTLLQKKRRESPDQFQSTFSRLRRKDQYSTDESTQFSTGRKSEGVAYVDVKPQKISGVINGKQILTFLHNKKFPKKFREYLQKNQLEPIALLQSKKERRRGYLSAELEFFGSMVNKLSQCGEAFSGQVVGEKDGYYLINIPDFTQKKSGWFGIVKKKKLQMAVGEVGEFVLLGWNCKERRYEFSAGVSIEL